VAEFGPACYYPPFMSCHETPDFADAVIDGLRFAADGACIAGKLDLSKLPRLADELEDRSGSLSCELSGFQDRGIGGIKYGLRLRVTGSLVMKCQRCLEDVLVTCAVDARLLLVPAEESWPDDELESADYDAIPASKEMVVRDLVEEEVLLALPLAPRHDGCTLPDRSGGEVEGQDQSPFAALANLKKH